MGRRRDRRLAIGQVHPTSNPAIRRPVGERGDRRTRRYGRTVKRLQRVAGFVEIDQNFAL